MVLQGRLVDSFWGCVRGNIQHKSSRNLPDEKPRRLFNPFVSDNNIQKRISLCYKFTSTFSLASKQKNTSPSWSKTEENRRISVKLNTANGIPILNKLWLKVKGFSNFMRWKVIRTYRSHLRSYQPPKAQCSRHHQRCITIIKSISRHERFILKFTSQNSLLYGRFRV